MANRRFEMYQYRQALTRMRLGDTDRAIARSGLMGRQKAAPVCVRTRKGGRFVNWAVREGLLRASSVMPNRATIALVLQVSSSRP